MSVVTLMTKIKSFEEIDYVPVKVIKGRAHIIVDSCEEAAKLADELSSVIFSKSCVERLEIIATLAHNNIKVGSVEEDMYGWTKAFILTSKGILEFAAPQINEGDTAFYVELRNYKKSIRVTPGMYEDDYFIQSNETIQDIVFALEDISFDAINIVERKAIIKTINRIRDIELESFEVEILNWEFYYKVFLSIEDGLKDIADECIIEAMGSLMAIANTIFCKYKISKLFKDKEREEV